CSVMSESADSARPRAPEGEGEDPHATERRIFRDTCAAVLVAVVVSAVAAPWRVTTGLLLGGVLAVFNLHWLSASVASAFGSTPAGARPRMRGARFVLRSFILAGVVVAAGRLDAVSPVAP